MKKPLKPFICLVAKSGIEPPTQGFSDKVPRYFPVCWSTSIGGAAKTLVEKTRKMIVVIFFIGHWRAF
uniref:Uncharacterized protein n=1 Tax=uncultured bacterium W4-87b TaxID=1130995 RepID=H9BWU0_9BACT|nr:hypothetical protein [uncultured bacterium W4-87b]